MSGVARLPFLDAEPWRVAVISPTGRYARHQVAGMIEAGTPVIGGVALGRGGSEMDGMPLYDRIGDLPQTPNIAVIYTPAEGVRDAIAECSALGVPTIVAVAEYVPVHDTLAAAAQARAVGSWLVGPNTLGIYVPGRGLLGSIAPSFCKAGRLAVIVRSGTVALALARQLTLAGVGQRIVAHIGGDGVIGRNPHEYLQALAADQETSAVLFCGEIGGDKEYAFAEAARGFGKAHRRHGGWPPRTGAKANGPCRRVGWQRARERGGKTRGARHRGMPGCERSGAGHSDGCESCWDGLKFAHRVKSPSKSVSRIFAPRILFSQGLSMKLHWSPRSPFVRKVMIVAHERGMTGRITCVRTVAETTKPHAELMKDNPLSKIPTLVLDDGTVLYDSPVICEYLDALDGAPKLFPQRPRRA